MDITGTTATALDEHREEIRRQYAGLAIVGTPGCCGQGRASDMGGFGQALYADVPDATGDVLELSLGCGNPVAVADLKPGDRVLDLGSGAGLDVILSAHRVGATGYVFGIDMTDEMLAAARANAEREGLKNTEFRKGVIEDLPLDDESVDVVISNCVINLSGDKRRVIHEVYRVLVSGGRIGISDVVAEDGVSPEERIRLGQGVGCVAGALSRSEYLAELSHAGFTDLTVGFTHEVAPGMHGAIIKAAKR